MNGKDEAPIDEAFLKRLRTEGWFRLEDFKFSGTTALVESLRVANQVIETQERTALILERAQGPDGFISVMKKAVKEAVDQARQQAYADAQVAHDHALSQATAEIKALLQASQAQLVDQANVIKAMADVCSQVASELGALRR